GDGQIGEGARGHKLDLRPNRCRGVGTALGANPQRVPHVVPYQIGWHLCGTRLALDEALRRASDQAHHVDRLDLNHTRRGEAGEGRLIGAAHSALPSMVQRGSADAGTGPVVTVSDAWPVVPATSSIRRTRSSAVGRSLSFFSNRPRARQTISAARNASALSSPDIASLTT